MKEIKVSVKQKTSKCKGQDQRSCSSYILKILASGARKPVFEPAGITVAATISSIGLVLLLFVSSEVTMSRRKCDVNPQNSPNFRGKGNSEKKRKNGKNVKKNPNKTKQWLGVGKWRCGNSKHMRY